MNHKTILLALVVATFRNISVQVLGIQLQQQAPLSTTTNALFPVLFESSRVLVVRKPHGISHHDELSFSHSVVGGDSSVEEITPGVLTLLRNERQQEAEETGERLYGIHRLDKVTSGILILAKDRETASTLSDYFARGEIEKIYFGMSAKKPQKKKQGLVQGGMARSRNKSWRLVRKPKNGQKSRAENFAKTRFFTTALKVSVSDDTGDCNASNDPITTVKTVAMFRPYTGKTHQLRVAAKAMGIPLLNDPIYKDGSESNCSRGDDALSTSKRTMLHASGIRIPEFLDHTEINVWCPPTFFCDEDEGTSKIEQGVVLKIDSQRALLSDSLDIAVEKLMTKNCDVPGILQAMQTQHRGKLD